MQIHTGSIVRDDYGTYGIVVNIIENVPTVWWTTGTVEPYTGSVPLVVLT